MELVTEGSHIVAKGSATGATPAWGIIAILLVCVVVWYYHGGGGPGK